jgi:hypothetical protein
MADPERVGMTNTHRIASLAICLGLLGTSPTDAVFKPHTEPQTASAEQVDVNSQLLSDSLPTDSPTDSLPTRFRISPLAVEEQQLVDEARSLFASAG